MKKWCCAMALWCLACAVMHAETIRMDLGNTPVGGLPNGWRIGSNAPQDAMKDGGARVVRDGLKKVLRIDDRSDKYEFGVGRTFDCKPGTYVRVTARYRAADPGESADGLELNAYFQPQQPYRAGTVRADTSGVAVMDTLVAPAGNKGLNINFYSYGHNKTSVFLESLTVETSDKAFPPAVVTTVPRRVSGRTFYVSPQGDNNGSGSVSSPWRSIDKVNRTLVPGDTAVFLPGRYEGTICPQRSGAPDAPIIYRSSAPGAAVLTGSKNGGLAAKIERMSYVELDGFRFEANPGGRWLKVDNSNFCTFRNLHMENADVADPIGCRNSSYLRFSNVKVFKCKSIGFGGVLRGNMWVNDHVTHSVYERMYIGRAGHDPFMLIYGCHNIVVRDSIFDCRWGRNFEFFSPSKVLMERCVITNAYEGSGSFDGEAKLFVNESVFRNNLVLRNGYQPVRVSGYRYFDLPAFDAMNSRFYNNTFYRNEDAALGVYATGRPSRITNNVFKNNIFFNNDFDRGIAIMLNERIGKDCQFRNNLIAGEKKGSVTVRYAGNAGEKLLTTAEAETAAAPFFKSNIDEDPKFVSAEQDNYNLASGSPAIDAGETLTTVTEDGKGTPYLPVADAGYFYDGFEIPGEAGDLVMIGESRKWARVVRVHDRQNMLVLDRPMTFSKGDTVNLAYAGKAPDLGAYESGMDTGPRFSSAVIRSDMEKEGILLNADFEPEHQEQWFYLWKFTRQPCSYAFVDDKVAATGKQSYRVAYVPYETVKVFDGGIVFGKPGGKSTLSVHLCPAWWDLDKYPMLRFSYRIPKGVPVGVTLYCASRSVLPGPGSVFVAETPNYPLPDGYVRHQLAQLAADGEWHRAEIDLRELRKLMPDYRYGYKLRFWAGGENGEQGSCYWLDDVSIRAN